MTIITPPAEIPTSKDSWRLINPAQVNRSSWTGSRQVQLLPGARYGTKLTMAPRAYANDAKAWRAFFASLDGVAGKFKVYPEPMIRTAFNNALVKGAGQTGSSLLVDGLNNGSGNKVLDVGDYITVALPTKGFQLLMLTGLTNTNGSGESTFSFKPMLREAPADNALVEIRRPYAVMSLMEQGFSFERDIMLFHYFELDAEETW